MVAKRTLFILRWLEKVRENNLQKVPARMVMTTLFEFIIVGKKTPAFPL
jgi:hypothetical protein